jgi:hypothetical protein
VSQRSQNRARRRTPADTERQDRHGPRKHPDLRIAAGITLLAWIQRLVFLRSNRDFAWPYTFFYEGDSEVFYSYARDLLAGRLYDHGIPFHPPGFAWFLAFVHSLLGAGPAAAQVPHVAVKAVMALVGSLTLGLLYLLARPYVGRTVALLGSFLGIYHFGLYVLSIAPVTESFYLALLLLALLVWTRRFEHPLAVPEEERRPGGPGWSVLLGLLLGALALTRAEAALVAVLLVGIGLMGSRRTWAGLRPWVLVALGWIAIVTPWTIRNAVRLDAVNEEFAGQSPEPLPTFVPLTLYGPINLALANNPMAKGGFSRDWMTSQAQNPGLDLKDPQHVEFILHGDRMAWTWIRENPGAYVRLVGKKWALVSEAWMLGWTQWNWPGGLNGHRRPVDMFVPDSEAGYWIAAPLSLLGLILCLVTPRSSRRWAGVSLVVTAAVLVATGLFFGYVRLGLMILLFWLRSSGLPACGTAGARASPLRPIRRAASGRPSPRSRSSSSAWSSGAFLSRGTSRPRASTCPAGATWTGTQRSASSCCRLAADSVGACSPGLDHHRGPVAEDLGHAIHDLRGVVADADDPVGADLPGVLEHHLERFAAGLLAQLGEQGDVAAGQSLEGAADRAKDGARSHRDAAHHPQSPGHLVTFELEGGRRHRDVHENLLGGWDRYTCSATSSPDNTEDSAPGFQADGAGKGVSPRVFGGSPRVVGASLRGLGNRRECSAPRRKVSEAAESRRRLAERSRKAPRVVGTLPRALGGAPKGVGDTLRGVGDTLRDVAELWRQTFSNFFQRICQKKGASGNYIDEEATQPPSTRIQERSHSSGRSSFFLLLARTSLLTRHFGSTKVLSAASGGLTDTQRSRQEAQQMRRLTFVLTLAIVGACGLLLPNPAHAECTGMCPDGSFPCCCNGQLIGCASSVLQCYNGCKTTVQSMFSPKDSQILSELKAAIFAAAEQKDGIGKTLFVPGGTC